MMDKKDIKLFEESVNNLDENTVQEIINEKDGKQEQEKVQKTFKNAEKIGEDVYINPVLKTHLEDKKEHKRKRSLSSLKKRKYVKTVRQIITQKKVPPKYITDKKVFVPKVNKRYDKDGNQVLLGKIKQYRIFKSKFIKKSDRLADIKEQQGKNELDN